LSPNRCSLERRPRTSLRGLEATQLVANGVMYASADWSNVFAVDARTGRQRTLALSCPQASFRRSALLCNLPLQSIAEYGTRSAIGGSRRQNSRIYELDLIEKWGSGIRRMRAECERAGLAIPTLEEIATHFRVTLFTLPNRSPALNETDGKIVAWLADVGGATTRQVAEQFTMSVRNTRLKLAALSKRGILAEIGSSATDPRRRYVAVEPRRLKD
jgi:glucose dehydrogenase